MHPLLQAKLEKLTEIYEQRSLLMKELPEFEGIIADHHCNEVFSGPLFYRYKGMSLHWGADYREYFGDTGLEPTNYMGTHIQGINCFHYDNLNTTFYFEPKELIDGLNSLVLWYDTVKSKTDEIKKAKEIARIKEQLKRLEGE